MFFGIHHFSNFPQTNEPQTPNYQSHKWKVNSSSGNEISRLFKMMEQRRKNASLEVKPPVEKKVQPRYSLKTVGHIAIIAKKLTQIAHNVGIAREKQEVAKENVKAILSALATFIEKISNELNQVQSDIKATRKQKNELRNYIKKASIKIERTLLQSEVKKLQQLSDRLLILEKKETSLKEDVEIVKIKISELKTELESLETFERKAKPIDKPPSPSIPTESPVSLVNESLPPSPQTVEAIELLPTPLNRIETLPPEESSPTNSPTPFLEIKQTPSISKDVQEQLAAYLVKVDKATTPTLLRIKNELAKEAEQLSSQMDFFIYIDQIVNNPTSKKAFQGISNQNIKAKPMFIQLQKKIQREVGTYPKEFDKSLIKSKQDLQNNLKEYATSRGLDSKKLETLFYEVANANEKTRVAKTKELTTYMLSK